MPERVWKIPDDIDPEVIPLCQALNRLDGIETIDSCCGHGGDSFCVFFRAATVEALIPILFYADVCHGEQPGWEVRVGTDCGASHVTFHLHGPIGAYEAANKIAEFLAKEES